ncbi:hypothetical protein C8J57DRAFT_1472709 [Mycena rebaudengoi]|nr:hypothetical protein C8J57DRAFT_1472709 [Mycena rebaudengoi]
MALLCLFCQFSVPQGLRPAVFEAGDGVVGLASSGEAEEEDAEIPAPEIPAVEENAVDGKRKRRAQAAPIQKNYQNLLRCMLADNRGGGLGRVRRKQKWSETEAKVRLNPDRVKVAFRESACFQ